MCTDRLNKAESTTMRLSSCHCLTPFVFVTEVSSTYPLLLYLTLVVEPGGRESLPMHLDRTSPHVVVQKVTKTSQMSHQVFAKSAGCCSPTARPSYEQPHLVSCAIVACNSAGQQTLASCCVLKCLQNKQSGAVTPRPLCAVVALTGQRPHHTAATPLPG